MTTKANKVIIYCDGACSGNQFNNNKGGWGAVLRCGPEVKQIHGGERNTTNQRMELTACIKALEIIKKEAAEKPLIERDFALNEALNLLKGLHILTVGRQEDYSAANSADIPENTAEEEEK